MYDRNVIKNNIDRILKEINGRATLLAATKTVPADIINYAGECGIKVIGENRVYELLEKYDELDRSLFDIHFIGHLQTNKVKYIIDKVSLIHSVDSFSLAEEIDKRAYKANLCMDVLVEVNIACEPSKHGILFEQIDEFWEKLQKFDNIKTAGLMAIPPKCENSQENATFFNKIGKKFIDICAKKVDNSNIALLSENKYVLSTGMSGDYLCAIEHGSTLVRIGSAIFGDRKYTK